MKGRVHSFQSLGAVDGPGLRFVIFLQGCTLRCAYCHNPDTWSLTSGTEYTVDEVVEKVLRYKSYFATSGGVTVSGGEPLLQWGFVSDLFRRLHREGIHTALDTAGIGDPEGARSVLLHTDLVLCDLKFSNEADYLHYARGNMDQVLRFLKQTEELGVPLWIRHVVVPELTDSEEHILKTAELAARYTNLQRLELLPFRKYCISKYEAMKLEFPLRNFEECTDAKIQELYRSIEAGVPTVFP
ncbi:pyruvate formate-lyase-activating protein [Faecalispora anaeroviscerum]|uniref:pyruvate formate-lyase-activating protein n=1 Tax=Faecalispora anaeroviscerum TaxID=2991836 RepID=UPI0024B974EB|nr:pyruvate formate-lyase-activating protein [Faecalispora anaeroviscerum]